MTDLTEGILLAMEEAVRTAGRMMKQAHVEKDGIEKKEGRSNFVTEYDRRNQVYLEEAFSGILPEAVFMGEENDRFDAHLPMGYVFIVDPIDGTTNFLFDMSLSCVSAGLLKDGKPEAGFVYNPYTDDMFRAWRGHGAFRNGRRLKAEDVPLEEGLALFGCVAYNREHIDALFLCVWELFEKALGIRSLGTAAVALSLVAAGAAVVYTEYVLKPWDYAASVVILEEAGCRITQMDGSPVSMSCPSSVIAGTPKAWAQTREIIRQAEKASTPSGC